MNTNTIYELYRLQRENQRLREALKPFAEWTNKITIADIERARQLVGMDECPGSSLD